MTREAPRYEAELFDLMIRQLRDIKVLPVDHVAACGVNGGEVLEVGCGSGVVGLEWLINTPGARLTGLDADPAMLALAELNLADYQKIGAGSRARPGSSGRRREPALPRQQF